MTNHSLIAEAIRAEFDRQQAEDIGVPFDFERMASAALAAQSQPAATVQEVGRERLIAAMEAKVGGMFSGNMPRAVAIELADAALAALTAEPAAKAGDARSISVAEEWAVYMDEAVSKAPEPLRQLGEYLAGLLDEDQWKTAERYLNAAALSPPASQSVEKIREALRPFAEYRGSDEYLKSAEDDGLCVAVSFTAGDYRRARDAYAALSTLPHKEEATPSPHDEALREAAKAGRNILWHIHRRGRVSYDAYEHGNFADLTVALDRLDAVLGFATPATTTTERGRG